MVSILRIHAANPGRKAMSTSHIQPLCDPLPTSSGCDVNRFWDPNLHVVTSINNNQLLQSPSTYVYMYLLLEKYERSTYMYKVSVLLSLHHYKNKATYRKTRFTIESHLLSPPPRCQPRLVIILVTAIENR